MNEYPASSKVSATSSKLPKGNHETPTVLEDACAILAYSFTLYLLAFPIYSVNVERKLSM